MKMKHETRKIIQNVAFLIISTVLLSALFSLILQKSVDLFAKAKVYVTEKVVDVCSNVVDKYESEKQLEESVRKYGNYGDRKGLEKYLSDMCENHMTEEDGNYTIYTYEMENSYHKVSHIEINSYGFGFALCDEETECRHETVELFVTANCGKTWKSVGSIDNEFNPVVVMVDDRILVFNYMGYDNVYAMNKEFRFVKSSSAFAGYDGSNAEFHFVPVITQKKEH